MDNLGVKVANYMAIADQKGEKVVRDAIAVVVEDAVSGSNDLITAKFEQIASNIARRFENVGKYHKEMSAAFGEKCKVAEGLRQAVATAVERISTI